MKRASSMTKKRKPRQRSTQRIEKPTADNLQTLIRFLNIKNFDSIGPDDQLGGDAYLNQLLYAHLFSTRRNTAYLKRLQRLIMVQVLPIAEPVQRRASSNEKKTAEKRVEESLRALTEGANGWQLKTRFRWFPAIVEIDGRRYDNTGGVLHAEQKLFRWGGRSWIIKLEFGPQSSAHTPAADLYAIISEGLITGRLARLRRCPWCKNFLLAPDKRERFCPGHAELFHSETSQATMRAELSRDRRYHERRE